MEILRRPTAVDVFRGRIPNGGFQDKHGVFHVEFDPSTEQASVIVLDSVAIIKNTQIDDLDPIRDYIEPDALNRIIGRGKPGDTGVKKVHFVYGEFEVVVEPTGDLWLNWA